MLSSGSVNTAINNIVGDPAKLHQILQEGSRLMTPDMKAQAKKIAASGKGQEMLER